MGVNETQQVASWPKGTNASFSFSAANGGGGMFYARVRRIAYRWEVIATESHARTARAMYPHQRAIAQFAIQLELKGYAENKAFFDFMKSYIDMYVSTTLQGLLVVSAVRNFTRWGIPVKGISDGDHTGSNVFSPVIIFESINDPLDPTIYSPEGGAISTATLNGVGGDQSSFFYPFSSGSTDANVRAETLYDFGQPDGGLLGGPGGVAGGIPGQVDDWLDDFNRGGGQ